MSQEDHEDPWYTSRETCPVCDEYYHVGLSGTLTEYDAITVDTKEIVSTCVVAPDDEYNYTTIYYHPESLINAQ